MGAISTTDARALFTKKLVAVYKERTTPTSFLRSFFKVDESNTKQISIEVQRGTEMIAVDVERGTEGNRNSFDKSTEKLFVPPYYREFFDATDLDFYDRLFTQSGTVDGNTFGVWLRQVADKIMRLQEKIERAYEVQCSQVLLTGIVTLKNGINIDFKRKATSLVALAAADRWSAGTSNPYTTLEDAANFVRKEGKATGTIYNVIMGSDAYTNFLNNTEVKERADIRRVSLDAIRMPQKNAAGGVLHGEVAAGPYVFRIWTYPEYYDTKTTKGNDYIDPKKIIVMPEAPKFVLAFGAVPQLIGKKAGVGAGMAGKKGQYLIGEYLDERNSAHIMDIKSAGVAIPVGVDMIYTAQVLA
jgi:hypothetical protein